MRLRPIQNHIIFQFIDEIDSKGQFVEITKWGFTIPGHFDDSAKKPRWGIVTGVGPECEHIKVGQQVLLIALKWTEGFKLDGERFWRSDETQVVTIRNTPTSKLQLLRDIIVFKRHDDVVNAAKHGIQVVGDSIVETPKGTIVQLGPDCVTELENAVIYYSEENFFNNFEHKGEKLRYIDEPSVLVYEPA